MFFFSKETLRASSARGNGKYPALCPTILDACLRFVQRLYEVSETALIKVINDKCSHQRRPRRLGTYDRQKYLAKKQREKERKEQKDRKKKREEEQKEKNQI